ncbi:hypothetical protein [Chryseobacterium indoltheticum]|uniref:hypothetical protein n=1 Tax=Chryseobacterium indoltheticum TaxID=254 RepID=UPI003F492AD4
MSELLNTKGYNFRLIMKYSLQAAMISLSIMLFSPILSKYIHELWFAIIIVGIPYYYFFTKIKSTTEVVSCSNNTIVLDNNTFDIEELSSYTIVSSLRLYFVMRITHKNGKDYTYYLPVTEKQNIESFFESRHISKSHVFSDYIAKYYLILYILTYFLMLGLVYYFGLQIYYLIKS